MEPVSAVSEAVSAPLRARWGAAPARASVTFLGVSPLDVLRFGPGDDGLVRYATVGCAETPMGDAAADVTDPVRGPRAELVLTVRGGVDGVLRALAVLAATPAVEGLVLVADALVDLGEPLWDGAAFTAVLLGPGDVPDLPLPEPADPVVFLAAVPVTATEAAWVRLRGAEALREAWAEAGVDTTDPGRSAVSL